MHNFPLGNNEEDSLWRQMIGQVEVPAFIRRANRVQNAIEQLKSRCRHVKTQMLEFVRLKLGVLKAMAGEWEKLQLVLDPQQIGYLQDLWEDLLPNLRVPVEPTTKSRKLQQALQELKDSIERFNQRWLGYLDEIDLQKVNNQIDNYNRYYVLEKECALRSLHTARRGFQPKELISKEDLLEWFPLLPTLEMK